MSNIRIVIDINIIVSALLFPNSKPDLALQKSLDIGDILISYSVWTELENVIVRPKFDRYISWEKRQKFLREFYQTVTIISNISETITDCRDPKDNKYLELALVAIALLSRQLKKRFGETSEIIKPRLNTLSVEQLELFGESLFDFNSFEDACAQRAFGIDWLNRHLQKL